MTASIHPPGRSAPTKASGTAIASASTAAMPVSSSVIGSPCATRRDTGTRKVMESPRCSVTVLTRKCQNCTGSG